MEKTTKKRGRPPKKKRKKKIVGQRGGYRPQYKLTKEQVLEIWAILYEGKLSQSQIATKFGVTQECISHICSGTRWNSVTGLPRRSKASVEPPPSGALAGRPRTTRKTRLRKPKKSDMKLLCNTCIRAILKGERHIDIKISPVFKFPESWPTTETIELTYEHKIVRVNARRLLDWLHKNKYTNTSVSDVVNVIKDFGLYALLSSYDLDDDLLKHLI